MLRWLLAALLAAPARAALSCVDEDGTAVDWWFLYKQPRWADKGRQEPVGNGEGDTYVYASSARNYEWKVGATVVNSSTCLLGKNLEGIYDGTVENFVFYNDQLPNGSWTRDFGHSKGWFAWDGDGAMWVQHSIPKFPATKAMGYSYPRDPEPGDDGYDFGAGQMWYGQHAFCMSLTPAQLNDAAAVMLYAHPWVYDWAQGAASDDDDGAATLPNVSAVIGGESKEGSITTAITAGWGELTLFGKSASLGEDMLNSLISPTLDETLDSQSWLNSGGGPLTYCPKSGDDVLEIEQVTLPGKKDGHTVHYAHATYVDHSKWAVAGDGRSTNWCALDNNHVQSQLSRSGLAVCSRASGMAALLRGAATEIGQCVPPPPPPGPAGKCPGPHSYPCTSFPGCTYVHAANIDACGVSAFGCYDCSSLPSACPDCKTSGGVVKGDVRAVA